MVYELQIFKEKHANILDFTKAGKGRVLSVCVCDIYSPSVLTDCRLEHTRS